MSDIARSIDTIKAAWVESTYYENAEKWTNLFWAPSSDFRRCFDQLDVSRCAELACGHGRHAERLMKVKGGQVKELYCLDVVQKNIDFSASRLAGFHEVKCLLIDGKDFRPLESGSLASIFCYDAMVHFSQDIVQSYLMDCFRVLQPGGRVLLHHSNLNAPETGTPGHHYGGNPHARNHMTLSLFESLVTNAGLRVLESTSRQWGSIPDLDRISLVEKPTIAE